MKKISLFLLFVMIFPGFAAAQKKDQTMTIKLFYHNENENPNQEDCRKVYPLERMIPKTTAPARAALDEFLKGTTKEEEARGFYSLDAASTKGILKSIKIKNKTAYVNFSGIVITQTGSAASSCGGGFFSGLDATLLQFPTIKKVFYAIEGSPRDFYDWVQVGECPAELKNCDGRNF